MKYEQGDIIIVPFPFSDLSSVKHRPVLILSKTSDVGKFEEIITCGITSNLKNNYHSVFIDNSSLMEGEIPKQSRVKVDKLFTLDKSIIKKKVARLNKDSFNKIKEEFLNLI